MSITPADAQGHLLHAGPAQRAKGSAKIVMHFLRGADHEETHTARNELAELYEATDRPDLAEQWRPVPAAPVASD